MRKSILSLVAAAALLCSACGPARYSVTALPAENGSISVDPAQDSYDSGAIVTITATPDADFGFSAWAGDLSGDTNPLTITVAADLSVGAVFVFDAVYVFYVIGGGSEVTICFANHSTRVVTSVAFWMEVLDAAGVRIPGPDGDYFLGVYNGEPIQSGHESDDFICSFSAFPGANGVGDYGVYGVTYSDGTTWEDPAFANRRP